jgi:multidrug efflux pump subunit AcrA (membrane-fusion protein)
MIATLTVGSSRLATPVIVIPLSAVVRSAQDAGRFATFVVEDKRDRPVVRSRDIELGQTYGNMISVIHGLTLGDRVVATGATTVTDGEQVEVIP